MTSRKSARAIRANQAEQALSALQKQRDRQDTLMAAYFQAIRSAEAAEAKVGKVRAAGAEAVAKAKAVADQRVTKAKHDAAPAAAAVRAALVAVADVIGENQTAELLGIHPREIRSARRSPTAHEPHDEQSPQDAGVAQSA